MPKAQIPNSDRIWGFLVNLYLCVFCNVQLQKGMDLMPIAHPLMDFLSPSLTPSSEVCSVLLPCWRLSRVIREIPARSSISISFLKHQHQLTTFPKQSAGPGRVFVHRRHFLSRKFSLTEDDLAAGKSLESYKPQQGRPQNWYLQLDFCIQLL